ncbi:MAG: hypothetical protein JST30_14350 [Armatimonadetes bacterium]|nr:hypothetical protein [Armatimonadota bacterium]
MKRVIVLALAALVASSAFGQANFTIRRPLDGSTVRETVKVRIPKNSIPPGGYIGFYVNGQFLEAALPEIDGDDYVYPLNTQAREIADGNAKIECVLFVDSNGKQQIVNRSSVNVTVDNHTSIKVPEGGVKLRYKFKPGIERVYNFTFKQEVGTISQAQAQIGSRIPTIATDDTKVRILYATDNSYKVASGYDGLMRIQILPDKGKDYATLVPPGDTEPKRVPQDQFTPLFMRISDVGREVFGSVPIYFGMDGRNGAPPAVDIFPLLPLPVLPSKAVQKGDAWNSPYLIGRVDPSAFLKQDHFTQPLSARGELAEFVWFKGMPCAVIRTVMELGPALLKDVKDLNQVKGEVANVKLVGKTWFAIDRGVVARTEVELTQDTLVDQAAAGGTGGGSGAPAGGSSGNVMGPQKGSNAGGGSAGVADRLNDPTSGGFYRIDPHFDDDGNFTFFQLGRGRGRGGGGMMGPGAGAPGDGDSEQGTRGGGQGRFGQRGNNTGGSANRKMVMRIRISYVSELEM